MLLPLPPRALCLSHAPGLPHALRLSRGPLLPRGPRPSSQPADAWTPSASPTAPACGPSKTAPQIQLGRCCHTDPAKHHPSLSCHAEIG
jgi:hypothetical protein